MRYLGDMHLRTKRRIANFATAVLFAVSLGLHGLLTTAANAKMTAASHMAMSSGDGPMNCPGHDDGAGQATCLAICAAFVGILLEPTALPFVRSHEIHAADLVMLLIDRSVPPDPYPPRPSALI